MANRNIDTELWNDTKIADTFTPEDKYFWLFLLTTRYGNLSGIFEISTKQIARDMGYSVETVDNLIYRFETYHDLISYNRDTKEMFIYNWYKYNWTRSPKFEKSLFKYINQIKHESFKEVVVVMYEEFKEGDTVSIPYRYHTNAIPNTNTISNTKSLINNDSNNNSVNELFDTFWKAYPRKVGKDKCLSWFKRRKVTNEFVEDLLIAIKQQEKSKQWQNKQYIPHPYTWLNRGGWNDELDYVETPQETIKNRWENFMKDEN